MSEGREKRRFRFTLSSLFCLVLTIALAIFAIQERRERLRVIDEARGAAIYVGDMTVDQAIQWQIKTGRSEIPLCEQQEGNRFFRYTMQRREISEQQYNTPHAQRPPGPHGPRPAV